MLCLQAASSLLIQGCLTSKGHCGQVETGSEASSPRTPRPLLPTPPEGAALPAWLTDWRLRTALASRERFEARREFTFGSLVKTHVGVSRVCRQGVGQPCTGCPSKASVTLQQLCAVAASA